MKISIDRDAFLSSFQTAAAVAPSRSPKPILASVKLETNSTGSVLTATDMEIGVRLDVSGVSVESFGAVILPVGRFGAILRECADERLNIEVTSKATIVKSRSSTFKLPSEDPEEFPQVHEFSGDDFIEIKAADLKRMIRRTLFATDTESSRYALGGILLQLKDDVLIAVATDGRRLAKTDHQVTVYGKGLSTTTATIVPAKSMQMIERTLNDNDDLIRLALLSEQVRFQIAGGVITSRLIEGRFPDWSQVIPDRMGAVRIDVPVGPFYSAIRQAAIVASDESRGLDFNFSEGTVSISGKTAEVGESQVEMPVTYSGDPVSITLDNRFFAEYLKVLKPESTFTIDVEGPESAALCRMHGYDYVIMPLSRDRD